MDTQIPGIPKVQKINLKDKLEEALVNLHNMKINVLLQESFVEKLKTLVREIK